MDLSQRTRPKLLVAARPHSMAGKDDVTMAQNVASSQLTSGEHQVGFWVNPQNVFGLLGPGPSAKSWLRTLPKMHPVKYTCT